MKNFNTSAWESPTFGKYRRMTVFLTLFALFFSNGVSAQGQCSGITFSFEHYEPCKFRAQYSNTSECFIEIRYILESGTFSSYNVNTAAGFTVEEISPSELWVHHNQGFVPLGNQVPLLFTLPPNLNTTMNIAYLDDCAMVGCEIFGGIPIESCPDPQNASIIGVKYRECGSLPYTNQPALSDWTIELLNADSNIIAEQVTDADGNYAFYDLPLGIYIVREVQQPGWSPSVPASGKYTVDLAPSQQVVRNFGNCPSCSCDNIYMDVVQLPGFSDTCAYMLNVSNNDDYCFNEIDLKVAVGSFTSVTPAAGWTATMVSAQHYKLKFPPNYIPAQSFQSTFFRVTGAAQHDITVSTSWNNNGTIVTCSRPFTYQCPPPVLPPPCCPMGSMFGPELVCNPDFSLGNQCFTSNYNYFNPGGLTAIGSYSVLDYGQVYAANNQWACIDHTTYTTAGTMLVVDGYNGPIAWEQQVSVTAGTTYAFSAWFNNLVKPTLSYADPQMALWVDGNQIAATAVLLENPDRWERLCAQYTATQTGLVTLQIRMLSTASIGNDVGIDDVSFRACIPPPSCVCLQPGAFSNMSYRPNSGPNVPISCGQIAFWQCNLPVFNLSGDFLCQGNSCPAMPPMFWTLNHPNLGQVDQGTANGTGFMISIPNASFPVSGLYTLTIAGICGMDTCYCEIIIETPGCGGSDCIEDFDTGSLGQWQVLNGQVSIITDPFTGSQVLNGNDNSGASWMYNNSSDYSGDWTQKFNNCFCFDIRYDRVDPSNPPTGTGAIVIYQGSDPLSAPNRATFVVSTPIGNSWTRVCAPVGLASGTTLPFNSFGTWTETPTGVFNSVITNVSGIGFIIDFAGGSNPSEMLFVDSICIEKCTDPCTADISSPTDLGCGKYQFNGFANGLAPFTYCWDFDGNTNTCESTIQNPMWQFPASGTYTVTLKITDATGCMATYSVTVNVPPFLTSVTVSASQNPICLGQSVTLNASGTGATITNCTWQGGNTGQSIVVVPQGPSTWCVTCSDANGCTATDCETIDVNETPSVSATTASICEGDTYTIVVTSNPPATSYSWSPGGATTQNLTVTPSTTTTYTVTAGLNGCFGSATSTVFVNPKPTIQINGLPNGDICLGQTVNLIATGNSTQYQWLPSGPSTAGYAFTPTNLGQYNVSVQGTLNGCTNTVSGSFTVVDCPCIEDFETGSLGQWQGLSGQVSIITDPFTGSMVLNGNDNQGASWMYNNSSDYNGDWIQKFNNCLCFDIRYDNVDPSNPAFGTSALVIYQGSDPLNFTKRATFVVNTPIGNTWTRVCVPVGLSNGTAYPSNQYGQWTSTSFADFDMVMQGVSGIGIPLDFGTGGGPSPTEMVFVDNFCVEKCADTCSCGPWTDISYRPYQGAPNQTAECGDTLVAQCDGLIPWTMSGNFMCLGNACPPTIPMSWMLTKPNGGMVSGPMSGPNFNLSIPASDLNAAGLYHLVLKAICGMDTCYCEFEIQVDDCPCIEDFETGGTGQWATTNGAISVITDPLTGSMVLKGSDNSGASWMYNNSSDYNGDWTQKFNNCLCFDIRYDNGDPSNPAVATGALTIYQGSDPLNFTKRATFVVNPPGIGNTWTRVCVPVGLSNGTAYPSNQYGHWTSTSLADFDMVMQGVSGIGVPLDFAGGSNPSEMVFVDNFCVEQCAVDSCCTNSSTFNNLIAQGFTVTKNGCSVTVTAPQFDNCYQFTTLPILDGENVQQVITPAIGSWTFNNLENGYHQICVTVFDQCNSQEMCTSFKIDCQTPEVDTSCCAYSMYLVNKYTDIAHIKKVRVSGICGTEICCADPDEWVQVDGTPNYIEWFEDNLTGVPNGDAIDNDFIIYLKRSTSPHNLEVEWFDAAGIVVCRHLLELSCDMPYNEDDDWTLNTSTTALDDPNLLVFAARAYEEDDESDCEEAHEERLTTSCDVSYTATCSGGTDYVVSLSGPSGFAKYFWEVIYAPIGVTNPTINSVQNPTFTATEGGYYTISLIAVTASNDTCTSEGDIEIPIIDPDFDALQQPCGYIGQFVAYGMDDAADVVSWSCPGYSSFPSSGNIVTFDFQSAASVSVTMTIKDKYGCTHDTTKQVNIVDCEAGVVVDKYCPDPCSNGTTNVTVHFKNLSKGGNCPVTYTWDYGDGTVSPPSQNPADGETHTYTVLPFTNLGLPCPLPVGGINYTVTLTVQDASSCISTATTTLNISSCQANFTYKACPDGRVDFYGDEPGTWDFTGSIDIAKRPYSDKKDKQGRQKHVRVRYGSSGVYLVKYTPHCPNGSECEILQEVVVVVDCCTKNHVTKRKEFANISGKDYKFKGKFRSTQFVRRHKIVAKTRMRKSILKIGNHHCWVPSRAFAITSEFDGKIFGREKADGCNCAFQVDIPASGFPDHPIYGPLFVFKATVKEVWHKRKLHPRINSITSTHTAKIDPVTLWQIKLQLGKACKRFHWWTDWY